MKNKDKERSWMEQYAPPGIHVAQEVIYWIMTMTVSTFWSMVFILRYIEERNLLYVTRGGKKVLVEDAMMPGFEELAANRFEVFYLVIIYCVIIMVYHYFYHYQGSKMMYLMKRLPNKWEVHIRCCILPIAAIVITILYRNILKMLCYAIYIVFTPSQCLPL